MNEDALLSHIAQRSAADGDHPALAVGPGDDCAAFEDGLLVSVDQLIEGMHFDPGTPIERIGWKAVARALSDIAAMGGSPLGAVAAGALPRGYAHAEALIDAIHAAGNQLGCPIVGGDLAGTTGPLSISVTVLGRAHSSRGAVLRSQARAGDLVCMTGKCGGSHASGRHLTFHPRISESIELCDALGDRLGAMIDVSDGVGKDTSRIARASGVHIELDAASIPMHEDVTDWREAISAGEDYELVFTARGEVPSEIAGTPITVIGRVREGEGCEAIAPNGERIPLTQLGWEHRG